MSKMILLLLVMLLWPSLEPLRAQLLYGSMVGNVTDPADAAVPGATVTVTSVETNATRSVVTNETGYFVIQNLLPGAYRVQIGKEGFTPTTISGVVVSINSVVRADATIKIGPVAATVLVSAETAALQTDRAEVRAEVTSRQLVNLPMPPGRNYQQLMVTVPGFAPPDNAHSAPANPSRALRFNVNGTSSNSVNTRIDGASSTNIYIPHMAGYVPPLESIETVNVVTNSFDAEQGLAGGAAINVQIKSGSNQTHGSAFWYHNNNAMKARPFFLPQGERNPKLVYNQFGGTMGGAVKKDRLFYFTSYEGTTDHKFSSGIGSVPTAAMRGGNFSASPTAIFDTMSGNLADGSDRAPFPGNLIPASRIHPATAKILPLYPDPNIAGRPRPQNNYFAAGQYYLDRHAADVKMNWNATEKYNMYGRFSLLDFGTANQQWFGRQLGGPTIVAGGQPGQATGRIYNSTIAANYTFTPSFLIDAYFGWSKMTVDSRQDRLEERVGLDVLGIPGTNGTRYFEGGWPQFNVENFTVIGIPNNFMPMAQDDPQFQYVMNANWNKGSHDIRMGFDFYNQHLNQAQPELSGAPFGASGGFQFQQGMTRTRNGPVGSEFNSFGAFLLGAASRVGRTAMVPDALVTRSWLYSAYIRDRWQVNRKLTISYGMRWEYFPLLTRADRGIEIYDWGRNQMIICGVANQPRNCGIDESKRLFVPRFGLAYRATNSLVIRAGYGITNDPYTLVRALRGNYPVLLSSDIVSANGFVPATDLTRGIPRIDVPDFSTGVIPVDPRAAIISLMRDNWRRGYIQSWNVTLQKQFGGWTAEAGYVATRSIGQLGNLDRNAGYPGGGNASRPLSQRFGRITRTAQITGLGTYRYDSLQTRLDRRFAAGYQVGAAYTFSKSMGIAGNDNSDGVPRIHLPEFFRLNRAVSGFDRPHNFQATGIAELPFGRGKRMASSGFAAAVLGGWQLNTVLSLYSGPPFSVTAPGADLNAPGNDQRADLVNPHVRKLGGAGPGQKFYDPSAFAQVRAPRFGTAGWNLLRGPGTVNVDLGLFRKFRVREGFSAEFRAEAFNATNTPKFGNPNGDVSAGNFMEINSTRGVGREGVDERVFRLGLRMAW